MIYLCGDTHGTYDLKKLSSRNFLNGKDLTKNDYVIILGDFGLVWEKEESANEEFWLNWLEKKPWTTLFIDGNHENHDRLAAYPISEWNGGKVHFIRDSVIHLMRGQVFTIEGLKFFTMGGASSHDISDGILEIGDPRIKEWRRDPFKMFRINKVSWWENELPSAEEMKEGLKNLSLHNFKVDYILTHCASIEEQALLRFRDVDRLNTYLTEVLKATSYKTHYCGHYHIDRYINDKFIILYDRIERIH